MTEIIKRALNTIQLRLTDKGETLAVIESVTSGNVQAILSLAPNATDFFQGGLTVYNLGQKAKHLTIDPIRAMKVNCVADWVAEHMAAQACHLFSSTWGIGITGYAAPVPEWNINKELFAWISIAHQGKIVRTKKVKMKKAPMEKIQQAFVKAVLSAFHKQVSK